MTDITSLQNERVKYVVKLRGDKRQRQRDGVMLVEGRYELELALASGLRPREVFLCEELSAGPPAALLDPLPATVTRAVFEKMSYRDNPDGWLAIVPAPHRILDSFPLSPAPLLILAESVEKPGNLGAILRTADAAGVDGLLVCDPRVDLSNPNIVRASRGTLFTVPAVETTSGEALAWLRANRIRVLAATPHTDILYTDADLRQPVCIAVGTEDEGLTDFWLDNADLKVKIPMMGKVNSLNVSTSTAIILYEAVRQRAGKGELK
ncbi:MAG: RNA methyltransferase TrmH family [Anaerolineaceae bacterium]|nr:MAG: RNA methyltransferase TrmH family [Anaerolineaceae bacterium]